MSVAERLHARTPTRRRVVLGVAAVVATGIIAVCYLFNAVLG